MSDRKPEGVSNYRDLVAWQKAMDLAEQTYRATESFPTAERFGLTAQLRRSAVSVPSNIAEGFGRRKPIEFRRFLDIAKGSLFEFQTQAELARRMGWLKGDQLSSLRDLASRVDALVSGLRRSIDTTKT
jgi:four helix bundle protein